MSKASKLKLDEIKIESFVTGQDRRGLKTDDIRAGTAAVCLSILISLSIDETIHSAESACNTFCPSCEVCPTDICTQVATECTGHCCAK